MNEFKLLLVQNIQINFKLNVTYVPLAQELELESNGKSVAPGFKLPRRRDCHASASDSDDERHRHVICGTLRLTASGRLATLSLSLQCQ